MTRIELAAIADDHTGTSDRDRAEIPRHLERALNVAARARTQSRVKVVIAPIRTSVAPTVTRPRRIALLLTDLNGGGVQKVTLALARGLVERGHQIDIVLYRAQGVLEPQVPPEVHIHHLDVASPYQSRLAALQADPAALPRLLMPILLARRPPHGLNRMPALAAYLRDRRPDALIASAPNCNLAAVWAKRLAGVETRVLITEHTAPSMALTKTSHWRNRFLPKLMHRTYQQADSIVAVSRALADDLAKVADIPRQRISTIYNPVVGPQLHCLAREPIDHPWFEPGQPPVILGAGRLSPQKDFPTLVRAFAELRRTSNVRLMILGGATGGSKTELRQSDLAAMATGLGVGDDVALPGYMPNPYPYMARASVFALTSAWEGFGNVLVEAMACGCPVVATDCPTGPAEILDGGRFGPLVPVGDAPALAAAIASVLANPTDAQLLRQRADEFTIERSVDAYLHALFGET